MPAPYKNPHDPNVRIERLDKRLRKVERRPVGLITIEDEGVDLPQRGIIDFVGDGVTATDNGTDTTIVTIPGTIPATDDPGVVYMDITAVDTYPSATSHNQGTLFEIQADAQIEFLAGTAFAVTSGSTTSFGALNFIVQLQTSGDHNFEIRDSGNNPIFRVHESDGSVHIKTGTTIAADL